jgi:hypothetical protein
VGRALHVADNSSRLRAAQAWFTGGREDRVLSRSEVVVALILLVEWGRPTEFGSNEGVRSSDGQQAPTPAHVVPFGTIYCEFGAVGCNAMPMNATRSSHFLSLAKRSSSLSGSRNQCSKAVDRDAGSGPGPVDGSTHAGAFAAARESYRRQPPRQGPAGPVMDGWAARNVRTCRIADGQAIGASSSCQRAEAVVLVLPRADLDPFCTVALTV